MVRLDDGETVEDLQMNGFRMIQSGRGFRFGEDSVLLANYAVGACLHSRRASGHLVDLGCNSGILSLIAAAKLPKSRITGVEINRSACGIFQKNIRINGMENRIRCIQADWKDIRQYCGAASADIVLSNPPYAYRSSRAEGIPEELRAAREEVYSDVESLADAAAYLLKPLCPAFFIYRSNRLTDVLCALRSRRLEPVGIRLIHPYADQPPKAFIVTARKHGKPAGIRIEKPLVIHEASGAYTDEVQAMYGRQPLMSRQELYRGIEVSAGRDIPEN